MYTMMSLNGFNESGIGQRLDPSNTAPDGGRGGPETLRIVTRDGVVVVRADPSTGGYSYGWVRRKGRVPYSLFIHAHVQQCSAGLQAYVRLVADRAISQIPILVKDSSCVRVKMSGKDQAMIRRHGVVSIVTFRSPRRVILLESMLPTDGDRLVRVDTGELPYPLIDNSSGQWHVSSPVISNSGVLPQATGTDRWGEAAFVVFEKSEPYELIIRDSKVDRVSGFALKGNAANFAYEVDGLLQFFSRLVGTVKFLRVVSARATGPMALSIPNMVVLQPDLLQDPLVLLFLFLPHEIGHYWLGQQVRFVGHLSILMESLVEFLQLFFLRYRLGIVGYEYIKTHIYSRYQHHVSHVANGDSLGEQFDLECAASTLALQNFAEGWGSATLVAIIRKIIERSQIGEEQLLMIIRQQAGESAEKYWVENLLRT